MDETLKNLFDYIYKYNINTNKVDTVYKNHYADTIFFRIIDFNIFEDKNLVAAEHYYLNMFPTYIYTLHNLETSQILIDIDTSSNPCYFVNKYDESHSWSVSTTNNSLLYLRDPLTGLIQDSIISYPIIDGYNIYRPEYEKNKRFGRFQSTIYDCNTGQEFYNVLNANSTPFITNSGGLSSITVTDNSDKKNYLVSIISETTAEPIFNFQFQTSDYYNNSFDFNRQRSKIAYYNPESGNLVLHNLMNSKSDSIKTEACFNISFSENGKYILALINNSKHNLLIINTSDLSIEYTIDLMHGSIKNSPSLRNIILFNRDGQFSYLLRLDLDYSDVEEDNSNINADNNLKLYPNPASDVLNIGLNKEGIISNVQIMTLDGKLVKEYNNTNSAIVQTDINSLSSGVYYIKVQTDKFSITKRFVKM